MRKIYISKKLIKFLYSINRFKYQDDRSVYYMIKQEIKYNPILQGIRFMSEQKFYEVLKIGKYYAHQENHDKKYDNIIEFYSVVKHIKGSFLLECRQKWYNEMINRETCSRNQYRYILKFMDYYYE